MKTLVLLNPAAGRKQSLAEEVQRLYPEAKVQSVQYPERIRELARQAVRHGCGLVVAGGGDGTVSSVAAELAGTEAVLGVLPLGTWNHFAKDLHLPLDLPAAIQVLRQGHVTQVDVGDVNGHVFLNNSSLGLYPRLAKLREKHRRRGLRRASAFFWAAVATFRRYPYLHVKLVVDGTPIETETPLIFVGNNIYQMEGLRAGSRHSLTGGRLCVCVAHRASRTGLLRLGLLALLGHLHRAGEFQMLCTTDATVETQRRYVRVAMDGEVTWLRSPLHYSIRPQALKVLTPSS